MGLEFRESDFSTLERFPLKWRWMLPESSDFPPEVYSSVRPLRSDAAQRVADEVLPLILPEGLEASAFRLVTEFVGTDEGQVARSLARIGRADEEVIVLWSRFLGVLTPWSLFRFRWKSFCHSAPGNVMITPVSGTWFLLYQPFNRFHAGVGRAPSS